MDQKQRRETASAITALSSHIPGSLSSMHLLMLLLSLLIFLVSGCGQTTRPSVVPLAGKTHVVPLAGKTHVVPLTGKTHVVPLAGKTHVVPLASKITEFAIPTNAQSNESLGGIIVGPDGNIWFTEYNTNKIGRMTPTGTITEFVLPTPSTQINSGPGGITVGPDKNLWFTSESKIGRMTPTGTITEFSVSGYPWNITTGPDGNLWFTGSDSRTDLPMIGRITPTGAVTEFALPIHTIVGDGPEGIVVGPDKNLWFTEFTANMIGRMTPDGKLTEFAVPVDTKVEMNLRPGNSGPGMITAGPDGNLWFTDFDLNQSGTYTDKIERMTPTGTLTEFAFPTPVSMAGLATGITTGPDGNLWFTDFEANRVGRITPTGIMAEFPVPTPGSNPGGITAGSHAIWFVEVGANKIGQLT